MEYKKREGSSPRKRVRLIVGLVLAGLLLVLSAMLAVSKLHVIASVTGKRTTSSKPSTAQGYVVVVAA